MRVSLLRKPLCKVVCLCYPIKADTSNKGLKGLIMGWFARHFGSKHKTARTAKDAQALSASRSYRAVTVYSRVSCCDAATRLAGRMFLADHAPQLPLGGCSQPESCRCRYRHLEDRRQEMRRDADYGLPGRHYSAPERRRRGDRRQPTGSRTLAGQV